MCFPSFYLEAMDGGIIEDLFYVLLHIFIRSRGGGGGGVGAAAVRYRAQRKAPPSVTSYLGCRAPIVSFDRPSAFCHGVCVGGREARPCCYLLYLYRYGTIKHFEEYDLVVVAAA